MNSRIDAEALAPLAEAGAVVPRFLSHYLSNWRPYKPGWVYEDGIVFKGCWDLGLPATRDFVRGVVSRRIGEDGTIEGYDRAELNIDNICAGKILFPLYAETSEPRYERAIEQLAAQLHEHPRTRSGNYWHKKIYPNQVWLDGLYMAQPFRVAYAQLRGDDAIHDDVLRQFAVVREVMRDAVSGLYWHGWDESREERWSDPVTGRSPHFWGRAMGWFVVALADILELVAGRPEAPRYEPLAEQLRECAAALASVVGPSGLWWQVLDQGTRAGNYEETSASLMIAAALMKGARLGALDAGHGDTGAAALATIVRDRLDDTELVGICGVAGLGNTPYRDGSFEYYIGEPKVNNDPKGVAALMMALSEAGLR